MFRMQFFEKNGVLVKGEKELFVDGIGVRQKDVLVSHAHSDHAKIRSSNNYFMTEQTRALCGAREMKNIVDVYFGQKFRVGEFDVSLHPSGHILGSAQCRISNSLDSVVTADFKLQKSILFEPAEVLPCDVLVIESTFGKPSFSFPARDIVYSDMLSWINGELSKNHFVVLGGYSTGKAQELTKFSNEFLNQPPLVFRKIFEQNKVYEKFGLKLGDYFLLDNNLKESNILIVPPHLISDDLLVALSHQLKKKVSCAIATGWKYNSRYKLFPLSDHADFSGLLDYVKESGAKQVFAYHGFDKEFSLWVEKKLKVPARPLSLGGQTALQEFALPARIG